MPRLTQEQRDARKINISVDKFGTDELILPTYYALQTKRGWKLVNPLTQERHISTRYGGMTPFKISRRPVKNAVFLDFDDEPIPLNKFVKKDREKLLAMVEKIDDEKDIAPQNRSIVGFKNASRGRPEKLQKNIIWNREHKDDENDADSDDDGYEGGMDWDMGEVENEVVKRARGRPKGTTKFNSAEAKERKRTQTIASNKKKALERETEEQRERRLRKESKAPQADKLQAKIEQLQKKSATKIKKEMVTLGKKTTAIDKKIATERRKKNPNENRIRELMGDRDEIEDESATRTDDPEWTLESDIEELEDELGELMSGGMLPKNDIDFEDMDWGSFTKQKNAYDSKLSLEEFADLVLSEDPPKKFTEKTKDRARFYLNVILKKGSGVDIEGGKIHFGKKRFKKLGKKIRKVTRNTVDTIGRTTVQVGKEIDERFKTATSSQGRTDFPPAMRKIMSQLGEETITSIDVKRTPVAKVLTGALSVFSLGKFGKRMKRSYDDLFHLYLIIGLSNGKSVSLEKEAVITMTTKTGSRGKTEESNPVSPIPSNMTLTSLLDKTRELMGTKKFFGYSAKSNNCQDFLVAIFKSNDIGDPQDISFIKQDTASLFKNLPSLRKLSNTLTTIGARADVLIKGKGSKILSQHSNITMSDSDSDSDCDECPKCEGTGLLKKIRKSVKKEAKSIKKQGEDHFNKQVSLGKKEVSRRANEAVDKTLKSGLKKGHSALHKLDRNIEEVYGSGCCMGSSGQGLKSMAKKATKRAVSGGQRDWIDLVKKCQKDEGCSYKEAMSIASALRKK